LSEARVRGDKGENNLGLRMRALGRRAHGPHAPTMPDFKYKKKILFIFLLFLLKYLLFNKKIYFN